MDRVVKPFTKSSFHFFEYGEIDDGLEWISEDDSTNEEFLTFLKAIPKDENVEFVLEDEQYIFRWKDLEYKLTLHHYRNEFSSDGLSLMLDDPCGTLGSEKPITLTKRVWTQEEYTKWLQFGSDEHYVYPKICPKCGYYMCTTHGKWEKYGPECPRFRCTNGNCAYIEIKETFVQRIRESNNAKMRKYLIESITHILKDQDPTRLGVLSGDAAEHLYKQTFSRSEILEDDQCHECGHKKKMISYMLVCNGSISASSCCERCHAFNSSALAGDFINKSKSRNPPDYLCDFDEDDEGGDDWRTTIPNDVVAHRCPDNI